MVHRGICFAYAQKALFAKRHEPRMEQRRSAVARPTPPLLFVFVLDPSIVDLSILAT